MVKHSSEFKHSSVRDLSWAVSSPPLITQLSSSCVWPDQQWCQQMYEQSLSWFKVIDSDPAELEELLAQQKDRRLGKYFETLWLYWLKHNKRYEIIANNLQVIIEGKTLGEIDFIVFDKTSRQTMHWEVAVKFYLGVGDTREMCNWHGPNLRDRLDIKVHHLLNRQSLISKNHLVRQWLGKQGIVIDQCAVILKGRLYYPGKAFAHASQRQTFIRINSPSLCSQQLQFGWWFKQGEFDKEFDSEQCFVPLINHGWLESISTDSVRKLISKNDIFETVSNNLLRYPLHVQLHEPCHSWDRAFIVSDDWGLKRT